MLAMPCRLYVIIFPCLEHTARVYRCQIFFGPFKVSHWKSRHPGAPPPSHLFFSYYEVKWRTTYLELCYTICACLIFILSLSISFDYSLTHFVRWHHYLFLALLHQLFQNLKRISGQFLWSWFSSLLRPLIIDYYLCLRYVSFSFPYCFSETPLNLTLSHFALFLLSIQ